MNRFIFAVTVFLIGLTTTTTYAEHAVTGKAAPAFTLTNALGQSIALESFKGKNIVLEWFNPDCPFVRKFYSKGDMPAFQRMVRNQGAVWLTVSSSASGKQGHILPAEAAKVAKEQGLDPAHLLLDTDGTVGRLYGAKTTPHVFVIDSTGVLAYAGAIDSTPSTRHADIASSTNYALTALGALSGGQAPSPANTEAYGCSIKY